MEVILDIFDRDEKEEMPIPTIRLNHLSNGHVEKPQHGLASWVVQGTSLRKYYVHYYRKTVCSSRILDIPLSAPLCFFSFSFSPPPFSSPPPFFLFPAPTTQAECVRNPAFSPPEPSTPSFVIRDLHMYVTVNAPGKLHRVIALNPQLHLQPAGCRCMSVKQ